MSYWQADVEYLLTVCAGIGQSLWRPPLWAGWSGDRIPVGPRFSAPVQTGPGARPASYTMGAGSFLGVKWPGHGGDHPPQPGPEVKERVELYLYSPSGPLWPVLGWPLPFIFWQYVAILVLMVPHCQMSIAQYLQLKHFVILTSAYCSDVNVRCAVFQKVIITLIYRCISALRKRASI